MRPVASEVDSHGHMDGCCQKEARMQAEQARLDAVLARNDPIRRQLELRQLAAPWTEKMQPVATAPAPAVTRVEPLTEQAKDKDERSDSDFGSDDEDIMAEFREKRMAELKLAAARPQTAAVAKNVRLQEVGEERFADRLKLLSAAVVLFFAEGKGNSPPVELMKGYLSQIAAEPRFANVEFWVVSCQPTSDGRWSRGGVLLQLMIPCLPALVSFRNNRVVNRCVGEFGDVFPDFMGNCNSVKLWVGSQGFPSKPQTV